MKKCGQAGLCLLGFDLLLLCIVLVKHVDTQNGDQDANLINCAAFYKPIFVNLVIWVLRANSPALSKQVINGLDVLMGQTNIIQENISL